MALLPLSAALRLADAEMLNAMLVRRDHCAKSSIKAFTAGLDAFRRAAAAAIAAAVPAEGAGLCALVFVDEQLSGALQAVALMGRKDDLVRRVRLGGAGELGMQVRWAGSLWLPSQSSA